MYFVGRSKELGTLRAALDDRRPSLVLVTGLRGGGKSALVRRVVQDYPHVWHVCAPLPAPALRAGLGHRLGVSGGEAEWPRLFEAVLERAEQADRPFVLVMDDAHRLLEARSRFVEPLMEALTESARRDISTHVVLVGPRDALKGLGERDDSGAVQPTEVRVPPLPFRAAAPRLPGRGPDDRIRAYGVFGGIPAVLQHVDPDVGVGTNVRRLLLAPGGPLADTGGRWVERDLQSPARYYAILETLARGEADWGTVHAGVPDLTKSGQVAPYLNKLIDLGLIETRRSIDASPGGRARRYAITDPFLAFWFRFILPRRLLAPPAGDTDGEGDEYAREIRPRLDGHLESIFPLVCRQHMSHDAIETLGAAAREGGSLWGPEYDLPVAGILTNGAAYFGACRWTGARGDRSPLGRIERDMRASRYGFGRERRLRLVFTGRSAPVELIREVVRNPDAQLIDAEALTGEQPR